MLYIFVLLPCLIQISIAVMYEGTFHFIGVKTEYATDYLEVIKTNGNYYLTWKQPITRKTDLNMYWFQSLNNKWLNGSHTNLCDGPKTWHDILPLELFRIAANLGNSTCPIVKGHTSLVPRQIRLQFDWDCNESFKEMIYFVCVLAPGDNDKCAFRFISYGGDIKMLEETNSSMKSDKNCDYKPVDTRLDCTNMSFINVLIASFPNCLLSHLNPLRWYGCEKVCRS